MQLFERIKKIRQYLDLSQLVFSQALGISRGHISNIETGAVEPSKQLLKFICKQWGVDEKWLKNGDGNMKVKYKSNITKEEEIEDLMHLVDQGYYDEITADLIFLAKTISSLYDQFDSIYLRSARDEFLVDPKHIDGKSLGNLAEKTEKEMDQLKELIRKLIDPNRNLDKP